MAAQPNLFKFEDQASIKYAVPEAVANRDQLIDRIKNHGGHITEHLGEAEFVIISVKVATEERLGLLAAQGCVVVDACWIWESIAQQALQPWYTHRLGVDEVETPAQERDINELAFGLARFAPLSGVEEIYLHLAKRFPHRTSLLFRSLHHENRKLVDFKVQELTNQLGMFRPRTKSTAALVPVNDHNATNSGAERVANIRALDPSNLPMDDKDIIMDDTPDPVAQSPLSDIVVPDADEEMLVLQFTSVTPPPDGEPRNSTLPDWKPIRHLINGPRQLLAVSKSPWRDPLPGLRGRDNVNGTGFPDQLKEAFCRQPRKPLDNEDLSADPTDIEAMARYLLSHDQGFFDEFYVDYRDGYKHEQWETWFGAHKDAILACGINLLKHSDFSWNEDRENVRHHRTPNHIQPTWSEELTLNLTPFEEELLAKEWNPVKDLEYMVDEPFCDYIAQQANTFLETRSLTKAGYRLRPRWAFLWTKRGAAGNEIKRRTARQWEHRFQKNDRVGELIGLEPEEWEDNSDDENGCYCHEGSHP